MSTNLFTCLYAEKQPERDCELLACLEMNRRINSLDRIFVLEEPPYRLRDGGKIRVIRLTQRPTFNDFLNVIRSETGPDDLNILANTDIYLDDVGIRHAKRWLRPDVCFALARWDVCLSWKRARMVWGPCSQDVWMFRGVPKTVNAPFLMGKLACDNRLAHELVEAGYTVKNPSRQLRVFHLHETAIRNYGMTVDDHVSGPYLSVPHESLTLIHACQWGLERLVRGSLKLLGAKMALPYERACPVPADLEVSAIPICDAMRLFIPESIHNELQ